MKALMTYLIFCLVGLGGCQLLGGSEDPAAIPGKIVFSAQDNSENPTYQIFTMNAEGSNVRQLTDDEFFCVSPAWSPDGQRIAFASNRQAPQGSTTLWVMDADGANLQPLVRHPQTGRAMFGDHPAWSPDGTKLAFDYCIDCERGGGNEEIFLADLQTGTLDTLVRHPASDSYPAWSPNGQHIAFVSDRNSPDENGDDIYLSNIEEDSVRPLTETGNAGRQIWLPDGTGLFYWSDNNLYQLNLADSTSSLLQVGLSSGIKFRPLDVSEDGQKLFLLTFDLSTVTQIRSLQLFDVKNSELTKIISFSGLSSADWHRNPN